MSVLSRVGFSLGQRTVRGSRMISVSALCRADQSTHTGQKFDEDDVRNVRFDVTGLKKQVNTQWAADLIANAPIMKVNKRVVACDGGGGALGHPKVYINLDSKEPVACTYCGLRYQFDDEH